MPQGFKNSPAIFQRGMTLVLKDLIGDICFVYLDDIIIFGRNIREHEKHYEMMLERLEQYDLRINPNKSIYCKEKILFLVYEIEKNKITPSTKRAQGIVDFTTPKTEKNLHSFLGTVNLTGILSQVWLTC